MKKLFLKVSAIAGMMVCSVSMSSCTHDEIDGSVREPVSKDQVAMSLFGNSGEDGSRTQLGENNNVFFCKGDSISVFNDKGGYKTASPNNDLFVANKAEDFPSGRDTASVATFNGKANVGAQYFAILYPYQKDAAATNVGGDTAAITATIPDVQKAKEGNFDPHASVSVGLAQAHEWDVPKFYLRNVCGLLKFTAGTNADVTEYDKIEIKGAKDEEIAGKVSISVSGAGDPGYTVITGETKITLTDVEPGKIYYVGILPQSFDDGITMDFFNGASKVGTKTIFNSTAGPTVKRSKVCNVGKVTPEKPEPVFSVSNNGGTTITKVKFAQGNLQATWDGSQYTWGFAEHQWEYIGGRSSSGSEPETGNNWIDNPKNNGVVDLFGWTADGKYGDGIKQYGINTSQKNNDYGTGSECCDWGSLIGDGWRVLTSAEWNYLISTRTVNGQSGGLGKTCQFITIASGHDGAGVKGLVIFPDDYPDDPSESLDHIPDGCVFLPCAGIRNGSSVTNVGSYGYYWSSSPSTSGASYAYGVFFGSGNVDPQSSYFDRYYGRAVRLVCASE